jgi:hypothetical protein
MDTATLISFLIWAFVAVAAGLLGAIIWFAQRVVAQLDRVEHLLIEETTTLDKRVTRLEDWRTLVTGDERRLGPRGIAP